MNFTDNYIGLPFLPDGRSRAGLDCWGLICLVYQEQKMITLPAYSGIYNVRSRKKLQEIAVLMERESKKWEQVVKPQDFDVVRLRIEGKLASHVGLVVGRSFLHIMETTQSTLEPLNSPVWKDRITGYYRYEESHC